MTTVCLTDSATDSARRLAEQFGLTVAASPPESGEYLLADSDGLSLCRAGEKGRVKVDFSGGAAQYRRTKGGGELIAKAVNHTARPTVWDATGGLGRDSFVLASLGLSVHAFEQNPAVACLLSDGLTRALQDGGISDIAQRITLHFGDACALMPELALQAGRPDVVYLDPMYPERQKSAAVKARTVARKRIVVKRPRLGVFLNAEEPAYQYAGKSTRFDVYLPFSPVSEK